MENKAKSDILVIIILSIIILDLQFFGLFGETFFRDFPIIFEGGYRISLGQLPYQDFYLPLGPVVFYIQAFFNIFLGFNLLSMIIHGFVVSVALAIFFYFIVRKECNYILSFLFALFFYLSFSGLTFYPFYNQAPYFFLFLNLFLLFMYRKQDFIPKSLYFLSAVLAVLAFYSKQDAGMLNLFFLFLYFMYNYKAQWKSIFLYYVFPAAILLIGSYALFSLLEGFNYWFNLGQEPHSMRFAILFTPRSIFGVITSWKFYVDLFLMVVLGYYILFKKRINNKSTIYPLIRDKNAIKLLSLIIIISTTTLITQGSSGLTNNSFTMGDPFIIFLIYILIKENTEFFKNKNKLTIFYFIIVFLLLTTSPFAVYGQILLNYVNPELGRMPEGCYKGILMPDPILDGLETIRKVIEENDNDFISLTEYTFLYCDYGKEPPKRLPLWFDEGISFFNENVPEIINAIKANNPKVILLQDPHVHEDRTMNRRFEEEFISMGYVKIGLVDASASYSKSYYALGYTKTEVVKLEKTSAPITILLREDLLKSENITDNP